MSRQLIGEADCFSKRNSDQKFADISKQDVIRILQKFLTYKRRWPCNFWSEICLVNARSNQASLVLNLLADLLRILISSLQNSVFICFFLIINVMKLPSTSEHKILPILWAESCPDFEHTSVHIFEHSEQNAELN